jgi:hypothetical protein
MLSPFTVHFVRIITVAIYCSSEVFNSIICLLLAALSLALYLCWKISQTDFQFVISSEIAMNN